MIFSTVLAVMSAMNTSRRPSRSSGVTPAVSATCTLSGAHESGPVIVSSSPLVTRVAARLVTSTSQRWTRRYSSSNGRSSSRARIAVLSSADRGSVIVTAMVFASGDQAYCWMLSAPSVIDHASPPSARITHSRVFGSSSPCGPRADTKLM